MWSMPLPSLPGPRCPAPLSLLCSVTAAHLELLTSFYVRGVGAARTQLFPLAAGTFQQTLTAVGGSRCSLQCRWAAFLCTVPAWAGQAPTHLPAPPRSPTTRCAGLLLARR